VVKKVNIFLLCYYSYDVLDAVLTRLSEVTKYENYDVFLVDNRSINSESVKEVAKKHIEIGGLKKAYFFNKNYMSNSIREVIDANLDCDVICFGDYDALIDLPKDDSCWLSEFVEKLESDSKAGVLQFSSKNPPLVGKPLAERGKKRIDDTWTMFGWANGHYITMLKETYLSYKNYKKPPIIVDGEFMIYVDRHLYSKTGIYRLRYDKNSVINLSSDICGVSNESKGEVKRDNKYLSDRQRTLRGGRNNEGIGFFDFIPVEISKNTCTILE